MKASGRLHPRHVLRLAVPILVSATSVVCSRATGGAEKAAGTWIVVIGNATTELNAPVSNAYIRSVASSEGQCDEHAHTGAASPEVTRTNEKGEYRQVVLATAGAYCLRVIAYSADSSLKTSATIAGARFRSRAAPPDSTRINLILR